MLVAKIASGLYTSASDVVREALRLMEQQDQLKVVKPEALCADIQEGLSSGESTPWNADEIKQDGRKRKASRDTAGQGA
jgi:antitoxin ParD1/3/4